MSRSSPLALPRIRAGSGLLSLLCHPWQTFGLTPASSFVSEAEAQQDTASEEQTLSSPTAWDLSPVSSAAEMSEEIINPFTGDSFAQERAQRFL